MNVQRPILKSAITSICWFGLTINVATAAVLAPSDDWTQWRGPNREGRSEEAGLMMEWPSGGPKQLWTNAETGLGYGGISVAQGTLFTVGAFGQEEFLLAIDAASGKENGVPSSVRFLSTIGVTVHAAPQHWTMVVFMP